jgi:hypothetical protein
VLETARDGAPSAHGRDRRDRFGGRWLRQQRPEILVRGLDPQFEPSVLARRFAAAVKTTDGTSAVVILGSAKGAAAQVKFMHARSLAPCPEVNICDVFWKPLAVPGIPDAQGSVRYRKVKTANGLAFRIYYIFFSIGPNAYGEFVGGPYGTVSEKQFVRGTAALYNRLHS